MDEGFILSVSQINEYVSTVLAQDPLLRSLSVEGELSGFRRYRSGHCYFSLKDADALIHGVLFHSDAVRLNFEPKDGMRVIVSGRIALYVRDGQYQLYANSMRPVGEGELYKRYLELKARLESEGLFDTAHKKPIPRMPSRVGVITSESGAAYRDILSVIGRRFPDMPIILQHSAVQGSEAPREIVRAIRALDAKGIADVIIVGRGGGSIEDLWAYNDEGVARAIYECNTPVISAVGHETDYTIADFVADLRAPTPSAAAELAVPVFSEIKSELDSSVWWLSHNVLSRIDRENQNISALTESGAFYKTGYRLDLEQMNVQQALNSVSDNFESSLYKLETELDACRVQLSALDPSASLKRGFILMRTPDGTPIDTRAALIESGSAVASFTDGEAKVLVDEH